MLPIKETAHMAADAYRANHFDEANRHFLKLSNLVARHHRATPLISQWKDAWRVSKDEFAAEGALGRYQEALQSGARGPWQGPTTSGPPTAADLRASATLDRDRVARYLKLLSEQCDQIVRLGAALPQGFPEPKPGSDPQLVNRFARLGAELARVRDVSIRAAPHLRQAYESWVVGDRGEASAAFAASQLIVREGETFDDAARQEAFAWETAASEEKTAARLFEIRSESSPRAGD
jgi:hypothetical protein